MRRITLAGTGISTTALGFGTSSLMGKLDKKASSRLLEVAYDHGIRHFDTAPLYGDGACETLVGSFWRTHPDITVTTKLGLMRSKGRSSALRSLKEIGRPLLRAFPALRSRSGALARATLRPTSQFDAASAKRSLHESLKRLGRDSVDILLLHECRSADLEDRALIDFLIAARQAGTIRAFGIGTDVETICRCIADHRLPQPVFQFANNVNEPNMLRLPRTLEHACITHTPFGGVGRAVPENLDTALSYAVAQNPTGVVLFSSQRAEHIDANARAFATAGAGSA